MSARVVAVDGPAGSGKSSVSRAAAARLGYAFLDTGAAYRALTWLALERGLFDEGVVDEEAVESLLLREFVYSIGTDAEADNVVRIGLTDVTEAIREPRVTEQVSQLARLIGVREYMVALTRRMIADCAAPGIVVEGRDITTVVAPHAEVRVLLTASPEARAARRASQLDASESLTGDALARRDASDLQSVDFLTPAEGVILLDTTDFEFAQSVDALVALAGA